MNLTENHPPYLHTRYLSTAQQSLCEQSPTYASRLADLKSLREELEQIRGLINRYDRDKLPEFSSIKKQDKRHGREAARDPRVWQQEKKAFRELEKKFLGWDDELAGLAEALLAKSKFKITEEVQLVEGRWWWALPSGTLVIPRHAVQVSSRAAEKPSPARKLSVRISGLWRKNSGEARVARRSKSAEPVF